jgi:hypothetical protein
MGVWVGEWGLDFGMWELAQLVILTRKLVQVGA